MAQTNNRESYLKQLEWSISALPLDEKNEAMDYYTQYFEDADDDQKVISELGAPEKLAEEILQKFSCVPATRPTSESKENSADGNDAENGENNGHDYRSFDGSYSFSESEVRNLELSLGAAQIVMISGDHYSVEARGINDYDMHVRLSPYGTLAIDNAKRFIPQFGGKFTPPRILITVPQNAKLNSLVIHLGAGSFTTKDVAIHSEKSFIDVGAGAAIISGLYGGRVDMRCGAGSIEVRGTQKGYSRIECGMGSIKANWRGDSSEWSWNTKIALGEVSVNGLKVSALFQSNNAARKENHLDINCSMGSVDVKID